MYISSEVLIIMLLLAFIFGMVMGISLVRPSI